jgi:endonuclease/exonuclease/phosphatase (EEP) superfamily protein YafD
MSVAARWTVAISALLLAAAMVAVQVSAPPGTLNPAGTWVVVGVLLVIGVVCFPGPLQRPAARLLGTGVFLLCCWYVADQARVPRPAEYRDGDTNLVNAVLAFLFFGVPAAYVAATGEFPTWSFLGTSLHRPDDERESGDEAGRDDG